MENLIKLKSLLNFIRAGKPSYNEIAQHLALDTLFGFSVSTIFLVTVRNDGYIDTFGKYGCTDEAFMIIPRRHVTFDAPVNRSLRTRSIVECGSSEDYFLISPGEDKLLFPNGFEYSLASPIPNVGSMVMYCSKVRGLSVVDEEFLVVVGGILSLELIGVRRFDLSKDHPRKITASNDLESTTRETPYLPK